MKIWEYPPLGQKFFASFSDSSEYRIDLSLLKGLHIFHFILRVAFSRADFQGALPKQATNLIQNFPSQNDPRYFLLFFMMITSLSIQTNIFLGHFQVIKTSSKPFERAACYTMPTIMYVIRHHLTFGPSYFQYQ